MGLREFASMVMVGGMLMLGSVLETST